VHAVLDRLRAGDRHPLPVAGHTLACDRLVWVRPPCRMAGSRWRKWFRIVLLHLLFRPIVLPWRAGS
jgi:hypothetical protein